MNTRFGRNTLVVWIDPAAGDTTWRVLDLDRESDTIWAIDAHAARVWPFRDRLSAFGVALAEGWAVMVDDPMLPPPTREGAMPGALCARRDRAWWLIRPLVEPPDRELFHRVGRVRRIMARAAETGATPWVIASCLRRYWQTGMRVDAPCDRAARSRDKKLIEERFWASLEDMQQCVAQREARHRVRRPAPKPSWARGNGVHPQRDTSAGVPETTDHARPDDTPAEGDRGVEGEP